MTKEFIYNFIKQHNLAVLSSISAEGKPEAALVGFAISEDLEIVFDTVKTSRKYPNLLKNPNIAVVIGWDNETTVLYEGVAAELSGPEAGYYKEIYFDVYKDGRERALTWPHFVRFKITPIWLRYSNFNDPVTIKELSAPLTHTQR
jgi:general stress protein 26